MLLHARGTELSEQLSFGSGGGTERNIARRENMNIGVRESSFCSARLGARLFFIAASRQSGR